LLSRPVSLPRAAATEPPPEKPHEPTDREGSEQPGDERSSEREVQQLDRHRFAVLQGDDAREDQADQSDQAFERSQTTGAGTHIASMPRGVRPKALG
jgi:hypothetical protein